jgi:hypothetical protein
MVVAQERAAKEIDLFGANHGDHGFGHVGHNEVGTVAEVDSGLTFDAALNALDEVFVEMHRRPI